MQVEENKTTKNEWKSDANDLWFRMGWAKSGPYRFDGTKLYPLEFPKNTLEDAFYKSNPNVSYNPYWIFSMYKDGKGNIWFETADLGIYRFDGKQIRWMYERHLTETPQGGAFGIRSITNDKEGVFWICNTRYKYHILPDKAEGAEPQPINYQREDGITDILKETQYFMSMTTYNNDDLWFVNGE